jgi:hypothetical protein
LLHDITLFTPDVSTWFVGTSVDKLMLYIGVRF